MINAYTFLLSCQGESDAKDLLESVCPVFSTSSNLTTSRPQKLGWLSRVESYFKIKLLGLFCQFFTTLTGMGTCTNQIDVLR